ncbi:MAG TPA: potassium channel family protein [Solimonas sp.]
MSASLPVWIARARRYPSAVLLVVQLLGVALYPWMGQLAAGRALLNAFGLLVLGAALWMVRRSPLANRIAALLAALVVALYALNAFWPQPLFLPLASLLEAAFYFYAVISLIAYMMEDERATRDELFAVGATFTVLAWAFAHLFVVCQALNSASFSVGATPLRSWMDLLFLSFTALSGVGLGDIVPLGAGAKAIVMLEEFAGVMYLALVVSRLIAMMRSRHG